MPPRPRRRGPPSRRAARPAAPRGTGRSRRLRAPGRRARLEHARRLGPPDAGLQPHQLALDLRAARAVAPIRLRQRSPPRRAHASASASRPASNSAAPSTGSSSPRAASSPSSSAAARSSSRAPAAWSPRRSAASAPAARRSAAPRQRRTRVAGAQLGAVAVRLREVVADRLVGRARARQPAREPLVQLGAPLLGHAAVRGLADQRVGEPEASRARRRRAVDAGSAPCAPARRGAWRCRRGRPRGALRHAAVSNAAALDRRALEQRALGRRRAGRCARPAPPGSSAAASSVSLADARRAARGTAGCPRRSPRCPRERSAAGVRDEHVRLVVRQRVEHEHRPARLRRRPARAASRAAPGARGRRAGSGARSRTPRGTRAGRAASARPSGCPRRRRRAGARRRPPRAAGGRPRTSPRPVPRRRRGRPRRARSARSRRRAARRRARDRRAA